jgi:hypothetical protein
MDNAGEQDVMLAGSKANTSALITSHTPNPSIVGLTVMVSFNVIASPPGIGTPTGLVTVSDGTGDSARATSWREREVALCRS